MAARTAWTGAVSFGGFPIHLAAYNATTSKSADSFKSLCPCHKQPIAQIKTCVVTGDKLENDKLLKGAELSKSIYALDAAAVKAISEGEATKSVEIERFAPLASVPTWLADKQFRIVADPKVPGSEGPANILWNGLLASERAAVIDGWVQRSGSRPALLVVYATSDGLIGMTLPYVSGLADVPNGGFKSDDKAATMFDAFVDAQDYCTDDFALDGYVDMYRERRDELIAKAIKGEAITVEPKDKPAATQGPDLMAAMQAAMGATGKKPAAKKSRAKAKA